MGGEQQKLTMGEPNGKLHVALFPWLAFGHIIPYLELAKLIAQRGHTISFISTPRNIHRLPKIPSNLESQINFVSLTLPRVEHLPDNAEATSDLPFHSIPYLKIAYDGLHGPLYQFLKTSSPDWIIYDFSAHWLPSITANLGISGAFFSIFAAWTLSFLGSSSLAMINGDDPRTKPEDFTVPPEWVPFPSKVAFRLHEANRYLDHVEVNNSGFSDLFRIGTVMGGVDVIAVRSCNELESDFLRLLGQLHGRPTFPLGLILPPAVDSGSSSGDDDIWVRINEWLNKKSRGSVVYIAFGSELELSGDVLNELALGLELSRLPFFWALRKPKGSLVELPDGFEGRVKDRGVVWTSWVPQLRILGHESVGGFMTHCGYSSVIEALHFGLALIMLPFSIDQGLIARVFEEKKVGVEVERDEKDGSFTKESVANSLRLVMVDKEGSIYKENSKEMKKLFADKDLHDLHVDQFVSFLQNHRVACSNPGPASA